MLLKVVFLGTSGAVPSPSRNLSAIFLQYGGQRILFDCGEGTQRQMMIAKLGFRNLDNIFITHMHTDHFSGIFGLIETFSLNKRCKDLNFYTPRAKMLKEFFDILGYENLDYKLNVIEVSDGDEIDFVDFKIVAFKTEHIVPSVGYVFVEKDRRGKFNRERAESLGIPRYLYSKLANGENIVWNGELITPDMVLGEKRRGRKIVYTGDTRPTQRTVEIAFNADLLIHDASFSERLRDWAVESGHSTAKEAAEIANAANVKKLILTHISARFSKNPEEILQEARNVFGNTEIAEDFKEILVELED